MLGFVAFDILLGADWLRNFDAVISCKARSVSLVNDKGLPLVIECKSPQKYAGSFIFSLDAHPDDLSITPIVQKFPDVFGEVDSLPLSERSISALTLFPELLP